MAKKIQNSKKEIDIQVQEAQKVPNQMNLNRPTPRYVIFKITKIKDKDRIIKEAREKK